MNLIYKTLDEIIIDISEVKIFESSNKKQKRKKFLNKNNFKKNIDEDIISEMSKKGFLISDLFLDSRKISKNTDAFIATKGVNIDRKNFIDEVISKGSKNIFCSELPDNLIKAIKSKKKWLKKYEDVTFIVIKNLEKKVSFLAENFYNNPSKKIKIIGVTGTNGKTTIAFSIFDILKKMNQKVAIFSTIKNIIGNDVQEASNTTPDPITISKNLHKAVEEKCNFLVMEVSSHALDQFRVEAIDFDGAIFTNLTQDHLDYHKTMDQYFLAKKRLFDKLKEDSVVVSNYDDEKGIEILKDTKANKNFYSHFNKGFLKNNIDYNGEVVNSYFFKDYTLKNGKTEVVFSDKRTDRTININLLGEFNIYNMLAVFVMLSELGFDKNLVLKKIEEIYPPKGRMEVIKADNFNNKDILAIVDYAHTPDALKNVLKTLQNIKNNDSRIISVVGAGGDRDKAKRPLMGKIAVENSDFVFFTSDNPRTEKPSEILVDILKGVNKKNFKVVENRSEAIKEAIEFCNKGDILIVAGKGHEEYQIIGTKKSFFSDKEEISKWI